MEKKHRPKYMYICIRNTCLTILYVEAEKIQIPINEIFQQC